MHAWQEDVLTSLDGACNEHQVFAHVCTAARALGFEHCAYGLRLPWPASEPQIFVLSDYPVDWQHHYASAGYLHTDPTVAHGRRTRAPLIWSDDVFAETPSLWHEAQDAGLCVGWAQSSLDANGIGGMLTMSRSHSPLAAKELSANELRMRWLVSLTHLALAGVVVPKLSTPRDVCLTKRETEVLQWTAEGKTSGEVSDILAISVDTVNFHIKNAVFKLQVTNKTAAVVRAAMLGWLN